MLSTLPKAWGLGKLNHYRHYGFIVQILDKDKE